MELENIRNESVHGRWAVCVRDGWLQWGESGTVLKGVNMSVTKGTVYGLVGASGCGKTTLLSCILGLKKLNSGDVHLPDSRIGYMPQEMSLCKEFTIREFVKFFGWISRMSTRQIDERLMSISKLLALPSLDDRIGSLSGGQQRRVSLATALLHEPELMILDEPTVGLDPILRESIWEYLLTLVKTKSVTIIITTHYIDEARRVDKVGYMHDGIILCEDAPSNLLLRFDAKSLEETFYKLILNKEQNAAVALSQQLESGVLKDKPVVRPNIVRTLLWKDFKWMWKNPLIMTIVLIMPMITIFILGTSIGELKHLTIGLVNRETLENDCGVLTCNSSYLSCHFLRYLDNTTVDLIRLDSEDQAETGVIRGQLYASVVIKENFTYSLKVRFKDELRVSTSTIDAATIDVMYDKSIRDIGFFIRLYFYRQFQRFAEDYMESCGFTKKVLSSPMRFLHPVHGPPQLNPLDYISSGILLVMSFLLSATLTAGISVIERNEGILTRCLAMGVRPAEILLTHFISQFGVMVVQCVYPLAILFFLFNITLKGSVLLVVSFALACGLCGMCAGFALATWFTNETHAIYIIIGTSLPITILSGSIWPLQGMNHYLKYFAYCLPLTIPIDSLRIVLQKGWSIDKPSVFAGLIVINVWIVIFTILSFIGFKLRSVHLRINRLYNSGHRSNSVEEKF